MPDLLELRDVSVSYGRIEALSNVSLTVPEGQIVALLGANGAGKTTTLNVISRLIPCVGGAIMFRGQPIQKWRSHMVVSAGIAQVPEGREVFRDMSVLENLKIGAHARSGASAISADIEQAYAYFPALKSRMRQRAGTLSGGEQQMLLIARALMARPSLLLLDEPSLGLSPILVQQIFRIIREINSNGMTILLVEQNASVALASSTYAYVLENGEIRHRGPSDALRHDDGIRQAYLGT